MMVDNDDILIYPDCSIVNFSYTDTSHIFIIIDCTDEHLGGGVRISFRGRDVFQNRLEKRDHIFRFVIQLQNRVPAFGRSVHKRAVQLAVICVQIHKELQCLVNHRIRTCFRTVDFVDADNDRQL